MDRSVRLLTQDKQKMNDVLLERDDVIRTLLEGRDIATVATGEEKRQLMEEEIREKVEEQVKSIERELRRKFYEERSLYNLDPTEGSRRSVREGRASSKARTK